MISPNTIRQYARGYLMLGMLQECLEELGQLDNEQLGSTASLDLLVDLEMERKEWGIVIDLARELSTRVPREEKPWISWAYALRELQRIAEARDVLLRAEPLHGDLSSLLHYNLACYYCLLGDLPEARRRLGRAVELHPGFAEDAREDEDLNGLRDSPGGYGFSSAV